MSLVLGVSLAFHILAPASARAGEGEREVRRARNIAYVEVAWLILLGSASVNYERILSRQVSFRVGAGIGYAALNFENVWSGGGALMMVNLFTSKSESRLESGLGVTLVQNYESDGSDRALILPAIALGYRYQKPGAGFFFRAGMTWTYLYGAPAQVSVGRTF